MKIALIGITGFVGTAIAKELIDRGHPVTGIARNPEKMHLPTPNLELVKADVYATDALAAVLKGHDIVISAFNAGWTNPDLYNQFLAGSQSIEKATEIAGVKRLLVIGGAGSLYIAGDLQLVDTPSFPEEYKPGATAARDYLTLLRKNNTLDWTFFSPAIEMHQGTSGTRKGIYRTNTENPVFDENNRSILSVEDLAVVIADETEHPKHIRSRFTAAY